MAPKKPCDPRMAKSIASLNWMKSCGKLKGSWKVREQVETVGNLSSVNIIFGILSPNPRGGIESQPVINESISFMLGCESRWAKNKIHSEYN